MKKTLQKIGLFTLAFAMVVPLFMPVSASAEITKNMCSSLVRDLTLGSTGPDVVVLQTFLEEKGYLTIPAGVSKGYFGGLTRASVSKYQVANGIFPTAGYFGPLTRGKLVAACVASSPTPGNGNNDNDNNGNDDDLNGGEASLESFDISTGDDSDVNEGQSAEIAEIEFDVEDGDVLINRIDLQLVADGSNEEEDPWDTFESLRLLIDGDEIADIDLSDEDEYLNEDEGTIRLSNINYKVEEGDSVNIVVEVDAQNSVDGADTGDSSWTINVLDEGIRAIDAEGIQQYIGDESETVDFDVVGKGEDDELNVSSSSDDPDATTLKVEDNKKSDEHEIFAFDLDAQDSDIEINTVQIVLESDEDVSDVISGLTLEIDGEQFTDWEFVGSGTTTRTVEFDIDKDYILEADSEVTAVLIAEFKAANGTNYNPGATIQASIEDGAIDGEGADDIVSDGTANGEEHTLSNSGIVVLSSSVETTEDTQGDNDTTGIFTIEFEVTAFEEDFYITDNASTAASDGVEFSIDGPAVPTSVSATLASTADEDTSGVFRVREGDTETFTLSVTVDASATGQHRVALNSIFSTENSNGVTGVVEKVLKVTDFRTDYININAN
jgi:hypothetical protein